MQYSCGIAGAGIMRNTMIARILSILDLIRACIKVHHRWQIRKPTVHGRLRSSDEYCLYWGKHNAKCEQWYNIDK